MRFGKHFLYVAGSAALVLLAGCAVQPKPYTAEDRDQRIADDLKAMFADQDRVAPITGPITLREAITRSLSFNLDHHVAAMEEAVSRERLGVSSMEMLPKLAAEAGYSERDNVLASSSENVVTKTTSLATSTSTDKDLTTTNLRLVWNVLDFGVSYYQAKQDSDRVLAMQERRRKAVQNIVQDVVSAYWRAVGAERFLPQAKRLLAETNRAVASYAAAADDGSKSPMESLRQQQLLLEAKRNISELRVQLGLAKTQLATLMNLRPGTKFSLAGVRRQGGVPPLTQSIDELERHALHDRPDLREEDYKVRISATEVRKAMARMMPGLEFNIGSYTDSNSYLLHDSWSQFGLRISWNLFNILSGPKAKSHAEASLQLAYARRMALSMAVMAQTRLAVQRYQLAKERYALNDQLYRLNKRIQSQTTNQKAAGESDELQTILARVNTLISGLRRDLAFAELYAARARIDHSIGKDSVELNKDGPDKVAATKGAVKDERKYAETAKMEAAPKSS